MRLSFRRAITGVVYKMSLAFPAALTRRRCSVRVFDVRPRHAEEQGRAGIKRRHLAKVGLGGRARQRRRRFGQTTGAAVALSGVPTPLGSCGPQLRGGPLLGPGGRRAGRVRGAAGARKQPLPGSSLGPDQAQQASGLRDSPTVIALEERACARRRATPLDTLVAAPLPPRRPLSPLPRKARRGRKTSSTRAPPEGSASSAR
ncbi:hypothetical protein MTO96_041147 [Rhipicephalus appendiculatus]